MNYSELACTVQCVNYTNLRFCTHGQLIKAKAVIKYRNKILHVSVFLLKFLFSFMHCRSKSVNTIKTYVNQLKNYVTFLVAKTNYSRILPCVVERWVGKLGSNLIV